MLGVNQELGVINASDPDAFGLPSGPVSGMEKETDKKIVQWKLKLDQIGLDVYHTDKTMVFYQKQENLAKLWDILVVYAWIEEDVGYCQESLARLTLRESTPLLLLVLHCQYSQGTVLRSKFSIEKDRSRTPAALHQLGQASGYLIRITDGFPRKKNNVNFTG